ncbi:MAG TPA: metallophosphoesterase [Mycobacteriales bacterium]|nr:metallophosphoesterase [Mycobacteriales bacterium]
MSQVAAFIGRWALRISLPIMGAATMLSLFPYHATLQGAQFRVQGSILTDRNISANTTVGSWIFPHFNALPIGVHISPVDVDLVKIADAAAPNPKHYANGLRIDLHHQIGRIAVWLAGEVLVGIILGLAIAVAINLAIRHVRRQPLRPDELTHRLYQAMGVVATLIVVIGVGIVTYRPSWPRDSRLNGTLASLQLFPHQLNSYYNQHAKALDVFSAVAAIQAGLQERIAHTSVDPTAFRIMYISDMHLASTYPLVQQYAKDFDVSLIVNTGDESEFGTKAEMTPGYLDQLRAVTKVTPMIWLAGNHDSPATVKVMRSIPGVMVLGTKQRLPDGSYSVTAQQLAAYGLTIAALPDPRVYGAPGADGSNDTSVVAGLERSTADQAVKAVPETSSFDIFATHEPVAMTQLAHDLSGQIRQTNAGHLHAQNTAGVQSGSRITLVEGSTGAGGLDNLNRGTPAPPIEFSIESVAANCQFTEVVRFQIRGAAPTTIGPASPGSPQVTAATRYFSPQQVSPDRHCGTELGITSPTPVSP